MDKVRSDQRSLRPQKLGHLWMQQQKLREQIVPKLLFWVFVTAVVALLFLFLAVLVAAVVAVAYELAFLL